MAKTKEHTIADKLHELATLQEVHSKLDAIQVMKGELPMEVADLEDELTGLNTRLSKIKAEVEEKNIDISDRKNIIKESSAQIIKFDKQLNSVKNNREFDALTKEIEMQKLEIQLCEKKIKDTTFAVETLQDTINETQSTIDNKNALLGEKHKELQVIISETEKEEKDLNDKISDIAKDIDEKYRNAYYRIRKSYKNGLAVVKVQRDACGGCFGKIPLQTQSIIRTKKNIITCEHCGRILSDVEEWERVPTVVVEE